MTGDTSDLCHANNTNAIIFLTILGICKLIATCMSLPWLFSVQCVSSRSCRHDLCDLQIQALVRTPCRGEGGQRSDPTTARRIWAAGRQRRATLVVQVRRLNQAHSHKCLVIETHVVPYACTTRTKDYTHVVQKRRSKETLKRDAQKRHDQTAALLDFPVALLYILAASEYGLGVSITSSSDILYYSANAQIQ